MPVRQQFRTISTRIGLGSDWYLILLAVVIGLVMGGATLAFILPITWLEGTLEHVDEDPVAWTTGWSGASDRWCAPDRGDALGPPMRSAGTGSHSACTRPAGNKGDCR